MMPASARNVWRKGFVPQLTRVELESLRDALVRDDPRLLQGATVSPPPLDCVRDWSVEAACPLGYCGWQGLGLETVEEVEEEFAKLCFNCDQQMEEPAACRYLIDWWDDVPRHVAVSSLLTEIELALEALGEPVATAWGTV